MKPCTCLGNVTQFSRFVKQGKKHVKNSIEQGRIVFSFGRRPTTNNCLPAKNDVFPGAPLQCMGANLPYKRFLNVTRLNFFIDTIDPKTKSSEKQKPPM